MLYKHTKFQKHIAPILTLSILNLPLSSSSTTSRELLAQFSTCSEWRWLEVGETLPCIGKPVSWNFQYKTSSCRKIKSVFRDVKWCFNASWGIKGLTHMCVCDHYVVENVQFGWNSQTRGLWHWDNCPDCNELSWMKKNGMCQRWLLTTNKRHSGLSILSPYNAEIF